METATIQYAGVELTATVEQAADLMEAATEAAAAGTNGTYWLSNPGGEVTVLTIGAGIPLMVTSAGFSKPGA